MQDLQGWCMQQALPFPLLLHLQLPEVAQALAVALN